MVRNWMILGLAFSGVMVGLGIWVLVGTDFDLLAGVTLALGIAGAVLAYLGFRREDIIWWSGGVLTAGILVPTPAGVVPMVVGALIVVVGLVLAWRNRSQPSPR